MTERYKYLAIHLHEPARQRVRELANTPAFASAQRERKKVEAPFAELKNLIGLRRLRLRRMKFVREFESSSSLQRRPRTSSDWCGSSNKRQPLFCRYRLAERREGKLGSGRLPAEKTIR